MDCLCCSTRCSFEVLGCRLGTLTDTFLFCRMMSDWQRKLSNLPGLSAKDKRIVEGKLLAEHDDDWAARFFQDNETPEATIERLTALLPKAGETIYKVQKVHSRGLCFMPGPVHPHSGYVGALLVYGSTHGPVSI